jgi:hypothetical protein
VNGMHSRIMAAVLLFMAACTSASAQVGTLATVGEIDVALNDTLSHVQAATATAGGEARSLGNSLQANIQNVLADFNAKFADRSCPLR